MDGDVIARMQQEEAELSKKLKAVRDLLAAYGVAARVDAVAVVAPAPARTASSGRGKVGIQGFGEYGRKVVASAIRVLLASEFPLKTRAIVDALDAAGVEITGENKINALGALLARSADITSHGKAGWSLPNRGRAEEIVGEYAPKENEPPEDPMALLGGSDAPEVGAPTPSPVLVHSNWGRPT